MSKQLADGAVDAISTYWHFAAKAEAAGLKVVEPAEAQRVLQAAKSFLDGCRELGLPVIHAYVTRRPEELKAGIHTGAGQLGTKIATDTTNAVNRDFHQRVVRPLPISPAARPLVHG